MFDVKDCIVKNIFKNGKYKKIVFDNTLILLKECKNFVLFLQQTCMACTMYDLQCILYIVQCILYIAL